MAINVNIGGTKHWLKVDEHIRRRWRVLDIAGKPDYTYDLNGGEVLPFKDGSVSNYYSSHTLEHIQPELLPWVISEIHRTLAPGGKIRVVVPDVRLAIRHYLDNDQRWLQQAQGKARKRHGYPDTTLGHLMLWFYSQPKNGKRSGHNTVFDRETLAYCFKDFAKVHTMSYGIHSEAFTGMDFKRHAPKSLYLEATK